MNQGVIEQVGTPAEIYREPDTLFVADFIGAMNQVDGRVDGKQIRIGELSFTPREHGQSDGAPVVAAIRPEDIVPRGAEGESAAGGNGENRLRVAIDDMEFLGSFWRVSLHNAKLGEARLLADMSINAVRQMSIEIGSSIEVELPAERLWVFPSSQGR
jgi:iron(III) transport system ATP-binding protein